MAQDYNNNYGSQDSVHQDDQPRNKLYAYHSSDASTAQGYSRPRASTDSSRSSNEQSQPRSQTVNSSGNPSSNQADSQPQVTPELVAQITQQVLQNLKINGLATSMAPPPPPQIPVAPPAAPYTSVQPPNGSTPSSPNRYDKPHVNALPPEVYNYQLDGLSAKETPTVRFADTPEGPPKAAMKEQARPSAPQRFSTGSATTLEKIWQPLFDTEGQPTARLGQFLRGLALHIIADFEPEQSLVITPSKMLQFYETVKVTDEIYPWQTIFGGKVTNSSLSHLYRDLGCQHFFVQAGLQDKPSIPALTPVGFECWMTHVIRAHPNVEYKRFADALLNMPISNADNLKERFPKELSRRLFPSQSDETIRLDLEDAILADPAVQLLRTEPATASSNTAQAPPPPPTSSGPSRQHQQEVNGSSPSKAKVAPPRPSSLDRERQPYSGSSSDVAVDDPPAPTAIERERKPYYSQSGGGKTYEKEDVSSSTKTDGVHNRSNSGVKGSRPTFDNTQDDYPTSISNKPYRKGSTASNNQPSQWRRHRSPEHSNVYSRSEGNVPALKTYSSNISQEDDDEERHYLRRYATEEAAGKRSYTKGGGYEDDARYSRRGSVQSGASGGGQYGGYPPPPPRY